MDTRSDVYSLGVLGFELLSGRLPHEVSDTPIHEAVRMIREDPPTTLSAFDTTLRGDIDTMIAKALEADPARRYASAAAFADDIRRYLADQPIAARPPSTFYQLRKFSRRNKALVTAVLAIGVALTMATAVSIGFAVSAERSRAKAQAALDDLEIVSDYQSGQLSLIDPQDVYKRQREGYPAVRRSRRVPRQGAGRTFQENLTPTSHWESQPTDRVAVDVAVLGALAQSRYISPYWGVCARGSRPGAAPCGSRSDMPLGVEPPSWDAA